MAHAQNTNMASTFHGPDFELSWQMGVWNKLASRGRGPEDLLRWKGDTWPVSAMVCVWCSQYLEGPVSVWKPSLTCF